jgi:hypothetical protein
MRCLKSNPFSPTDSPDGPSQKIIFPSGAAAAFRIGSCRKNVASACANSLSKTNNLIPKNAPTALQP